MRWRWLRVSHIVVVFLSAVMMFENISRRVGAHWAEDSVAMIGMPLLIHTSFGFFFIRAVRSPVPNNLNGALIINAVYSALACMGLAIGAALVFSDDGKLGDHGAWYALVAHLLQLVLCAVNVVLIQQSQSEIDSNRIKSKTVL